ncbi:DUF4283 domain-containing protein [Abeliophyllum distichum]|uniref:DUF4283 domain-containing protein n=1 Tax=Abeliophyllum distichum TaxID=126358 RepID=A0ABD1RF58_9LAMI
MRVLKWTCDFGPDCETPIAPVWLSFPLLPVHMRSKGVFALAKIVGIPLHIDEATANLLRPSEARCRAGGPPFTPSPTVALSGQPHPSTSLPHLPTQTISAPLVTSTVTEITDRARKAKGKEVVVDQPQQWAPSESRYFLTSGPAIVPSSHVGPTAEFLQTSVFAYDYSLHVGPTISLPFMVGPITESCSIIDPVYGSSLHDRLAISVGPNSTYVHSEFFDPLLELMLAAPRAGVYLDDPFHLFLQ